MGMGRIFRIMRSRELKLGSEVMCRSIDRSVELRVTFFDFREWSEEKRKNGE